jgi:4-hydroxybenzoyl-CoA thioesterase/acyl-CoA thioester hydrolase
MACHYAKPARLDEALTVTANIAEKGRCRMTFEQLVRRDEELLCSATVEIACLNATTLRPKAWPLSLNTTPQSKTTLID